MKVNAKHIIGSVARILVGVVVGAGLIFGVLICIARH